MRSHIAGRWLVGVPDIISHVDAVETIVTAPPKPPLGIDQDPPGPVSDDLPRATSSLRRGVLWQFLSQSSTSRAKPAGRPPSPCPHSRLVKYPGKPPVVA